MESSDRMFVVIGGKEYFIEGNTLRPSQSSFEREVLSRLDGIESRLGNLEAQVGVLEQGQRVLHVQIDSLQTSVYWVLAAIGIFLASITLPPLIIGLFRKWTGAEKQSEAKGFSLQDVIALLSWNDQHRKNEDSHSQR